MGEEGLYWVAMISALLSALGSGVVVVVAVAAWDWQFDRAWVPGSIGAFSFILAMFAMYKESDREKISGMALDAGIVQAVWMERRHWYVSQTETSGWDNIQHFRIGGIGQSESDFREYETDDGRTFNFKEGDQVVISHHGKVVDVYELAHLRLI